MGAVEQEIRDRAADSLAELARLDVRPMFSGFGFYLDGLLVAAAWDGAFRLRYREDDRWMYRPVDPVVLDDPVTLVQLVRARSEQLAQDPHARRTKPGRRTVERASDAR